MMREQFDKQLAALRQELVAIYTQIDLVLHDAVDALLDGDKEKARRVIKATYSIDDRCAELEDSAYNQIVLQNPVASDLRLLQFIIYANFNLERMSNHTRNIARTAKRAAGTELPGDFKELLDAEAHLVYRVLGATVRCVVENDLSAAATLPELDHPVNELYASFYRSFAYLKKPDEIDVASRILMAARMLERISDNAVEVGERVVFLLTGSREHLGELARLDEEELEDMYVSQAPSFTIGSEKIERVANQIPEMEEAEQEAKIGEVPRFAHRLNRALEMAKEAAEARARNRKEAQQAQQEKNADRQE